MASAFTHAFVGTVIGKVFKEGRKMPARFWVGLAVCAAFPDVDVIGYWFGVPLGSPWGHRGFTHSIFFALILAWVAVELLFRYEKRFSRPWWALCVCFFLVSVSHGMLDACTDGGRGIAFFWPFSNARYFFPWRPIVVSPLGVSHFYGGRAIRIIESEFLWVWLPTFFLYGVFKAVKKVARALWKGNDEIPIGLASLFHKKNYKSKQLKEWFHIAFDQEKVVSHASPPGQEAWEQFFYWKDVVRIVFMAGDFMASDGIYVFTKTRPESYSIPIEAEGGDAFWKEILRRGLFDPELATRAMAASEGVFIWPPENG